MTSSCSQLKACDALVIALESLSIPKMFNSLKIQDGMRSHCLDNKAHLEIYLRLNSISLDKITQP
jgi:hypothetical protein